MMNRSLAIRITTIFLMGAVAALGLWGCSDSDISSPVAQNESSESVFSASNPAVRNVMLVQDAHTEVLMANPDVIGTATTLDENG